MSKKQKSIDIVGNPFRLLLNLFEIPKSQDFFLLPSAQILNQTQKII